MTDKKSPMARRILPRAYGEDFAAKHVFTRPAPSFAPARCGVCGLRHGKCTYAQTTAWAARMPDDQTIQERAEFLAHEIMGDGMAQEDELAEAIVREIRRFMR